MDTGKKKKLGREADLILGIIWLGKQGFYFSIGLNASGSSQLTNPSPYLLLLLLIFYYVYYYVIYLLFINYLFRYIFHFINHVLYDSLLSMFDVACT